MYWLKYLTSLKQGGPGKSQAAICGSRASDCLAPGVALCALNVHKDCE